MNSAYKTFILIAALVFSFSFVGKEPPKDRQIRFKNTKFNQVAREARKTDKPIFAMVCASWCTNCNKMREKVFNDPQVAAFFNEHFVSTLVDAEDYKNNMRVTGWGVKSVPTLVFLTSDKRVIYLTSGFKDKDKMLQEGKNALKLMR